MGEAPSEDRVEPASVEPSTQAEVAWSPPPKPVQFIPYQIMLPGRPGHEFARLVLPADLTETEAERLCGVIRTLAFSKEAIDAAHQQERDRELRDHLSQVESEAKFRARMANQD